MIEVIGSIKGGKRYRTKWWFRYCLSLL